MESLTEQIDVTVYFVGSDRGLQGKVHQFHYNAKVTLLTSKKAAQLVSDIAIQINIPDRLLGLGVEGLQNLNDVGLTIQKFEGVDLSLGSL